MAKKTTATRSGGAIIINTPASPARRRVSALARRVGGAAKKHGRRIGAAGAKKAWQRRALLGAGGVGALMGYLIKNNVDVPTLGPLGKNGTVAAALVVGSMFMRNEWLDHMAAGAVAIVAYDWQREGHINGVGGRYGHAHRIIDQAGR